MKQKRIHPQNFLIILISARSLSISLEYHLHWHDELELVVIKRGQGFVSVDFDKRLVHSGDIIIIPPRCLHAIEQDDTFKMEYENIIFKPDLLSSGANDLCMIQYIVPLLDGSLSY